MVSIIMSRNSPRKQKTKKKITVSQMKSSLMGPKCRGI